MTYEVEAYTPPLQPQDRIESALEDIIGAMPPKDVDALGNNLDIYTEQELRDALAGYALAEIQHNEDSPLRIPLTELVVYSYLSPADRFRRVNGGDILAIDDDGNFVGLYGAEIRKMQPGHMDAGKEYVSDYSYVNILSGSFRGSKSTPQGYPIPEPNEGQVKAAVQWHDVPFRPDSF